MPYHTGCIVDIYHIIFSGNARFSDIRAKENEQRSYKMVKGHNLKNICFHPKSIR